METLIRECLVIVKYIKVKLKKPPSKVYVESNYGKVSGNNGEPILKYVNIRL